MFPGCPDKFQDVQTHVKLLMKAMVAMGGKDIVFFISLQY